MGGHGRRDPGAWVTVFGRSRTWSSFCGVEQSTFEDCLRAALDDLGYAYEREEGSGSFMLGEGASANYEVRVPDADDPATVRVYFASGDPMLRFLAAFRAGDADLGGVCVVRVRVPDGGEDGVRRLMRAAVEALPRDPADVAHHPRFRLAPLARWRIRRQWRRWRG